MKTAATVVTDWQNFIVGDLADVKTGPFGSALHASDYKMLGTPIITVEHLGERNITRQNLPLVGDEDTRRLAVYKLQEGDIVFSRVGSIDRCALVTEAEAGWLFSGRLLRLRGISQHYHPELLIQIFKTPNFLAQVRAIAVGQTMPSLNTKILNGIIVRLPTKRVEQNAVASALGDVDALIDSIDSLIDKKKDIKQGAMQQLLTGKTRLPGFSGGWEVRRVKHFTRCVAGGTPSTLKPEYWIDGQIPWMSSGELHAKRIKKVRGRITTLGLAESSAQLVPVGSVLIGLAGQGKTRGTVAISEIELSTNQSIAAIFPSKDFCSDYLFHNLCSRYDELRSLSTGDGGRGGLNLTILGNLEIPWPPVKEQEVIAQILSDMDAEIDALVARKEKTALIKTGMMQELLTGRIRLL